MLHISDAQPFRQWLLNLVLKPLKDRPVRVIIILHFVSVLQRSIPLTQTQLSHLSDVQ